MKTTAIFFSLLFLLSVAVAQTASVAPPANASTAGGSAFAGPLTNSARTTQLLINSSQLTSLVGRQLKGLTFRLPSSSSVAWPATAITFSNYDVYLSGSVAPAQRSLNLVDNIIGTQTLVRSGSLNIPAGSFTAGGSPNTFGSVINFTTPYVYSGGNLLVEIRHNGSTASSGVDAVSVSASGYGTDFSSCWGNGYTATSGMQANFSVVQFTYDVALPVTISSFNAIQQFPNTQVNWTTASELNTQHFIIERSTDGRSFVPVATVKAAGASATSRNYQFTDRNVSTLNSDVIYYRLQMVDKDGTFNYSTVATINISRKSAPVALYPNPAKDKTTLTGVEAGMSIRLLDAAGKVVQVKNATGTTESLLVSGLAKGIYTIQVYNSGGAIFSSTPLVKE